MKWQHGRYSACAHLTRGYDYIHSRKTKGDVSIQIVFLKRIEENHAHQRV